MTGMRSEHRKSVETADSAEFVRLQARSTDQRAVHIGLLHDAGDVRGLHRAAVEDADRRPSCLAVCLGDTGADGSGDLLRVLRSGYLARSDRPDGLVGNDQTRHLLGAEPIERTLDLGQAMPDVVAL